jgi:hypothetical protein
LAAVLQTRSWVTAKVIEPNRVKPFVNRLEFLGFEYKLESDNREVRIYVKEDRLEETLDWFVPLSHQLPHQPTVNAATQNKSLALALLVSIPLGMLAGSAFGICIGMPGELMLATSSFGGLIGVVIGWAYACRK